MSFLDIINPFALKEMRQMTRSRSIGALVVLYLVAEIVLLITSNPFDANIRFARSFLDVIKYSLIVIAMLIIPVFILFKTTTEKDSDADPLIFVTAIKPSQMADGKVLSGIATLSVFIACAVPFMIMMAVAGKIGIFEIICSIVFVLSLGAASIYTAITCALLEIPKSIRVFLFFCFVAFFKLAELSYHHSRYFDVNYTIIDMCTYLGLALFIISSRANCVALLRPEQSDRFYVWRITHLLICFVLAVLILTTADLPTCTTYKLLVWFYVLHAMFVNISSVPRTSKAVLNERSCRKWLRALRYPFTTYGDSGIIYSMLLLVIAAVVTKLMYRYHSSDEFIPLMCYHLVEIMLFTRLIVKLINRKSLYRFAGIIAYALVFVLNLVGIILDFKGYPFLTLFGYKGDYQTELTIATIFVLLVIMSPSLIRSFRQYVFKDLIRE